VFQKVARVGRMLTAAANDQLHDVVHPNNPQIKGVTISLISGPYDKNKNKNKNKNKEKNTNSSSISIGNEAIRRQNAVTISTGYLDWENRDTWRGVLDRSPCGKFNAHTIHIYIYIIRTQHIYIYTYMHTHYICLGLSEKITQETTQKQKQFSICLGKFELRRIHAGIF
jgi:hypothetical protein